MKKIIKKIKSNSLFTFILGGLIFGSIGIYGANNYQSNTIEYSPTDTSWEVSNVNQAINSLYGMKQELDNIKGIGDATAAQILSGKKAVVKGNTITGTMKNMSNAWVWTSNGIENYTYSSGTTANMVYVRPRDEWGDGYITTNSKFIVGTESDLKKSLLAGKTLVGVTGTATSDATATAADIASGKTAYINGSKVTGTASVLGQVTGSANLMSGATDTTVTTPTLTLNVKNYTSIQIKVTSTYASSASLSVSTNNGSINTKLAPGTYTYQLNSATTITFSYYCNISTYSNGTFSYTLIP